MNYFQLKEQLQKDKQIYITGHIHPDGDCIGSNLALYLLLKNDGYNVDVVIQEAVSNYSYIAGHSEIKDFAWYEDHKDSLLSSDYDLIVMDSGDLTRIEIFSELFEHASITFNIDHHNSNTSFADFNIVDVKASSTSELVGIMIGLDEPGTTTSSEIATSLYMGIIYDTGGFKHENVRPVTHQIVAGLKASGINQTFIMNHMFNRKTKESLRALQFAIKNMELANDETIVFTYLTLNQMQEYGVVKKDTEAIVNIMLEIDTVKLSCFAIELEPNYYKISLRSDSPVDVCAIASRHNGGGHIKAAGCSMNAPIEDVKSSMIEELTQAYERHH